MQKRKKKLGGLEEREFLNGQSIGSQMKNEIFNLNIHVQDSPQTPDPSPKQGFFFFFLFVCFFFCFCPCTASFFN